MLNSNSVKLKAYAKINLCLDVTGKRPDGYHDLISVMQTVSLYDSIYMKSVFKNNYLKIISNLWFLPTDERNIVYKAIKVLLDKYRISGGIFVDLKKTIPVCAGLGGGSSDCAAALLGMKALFNLPLTTDELIDIGKKLGADVPFFFIKGTALAKGVGEILTPLTPIPPCIFVLVRPPIFISTADVFKKFRMENVKNHLDEERMLFAINKGDLPGICENFINSLETVTCAQHPIIEELKQELIFHGALGALMSGSGPTVFGCFNDMTSAKSAITAIRQKHRGIKDIYIVKTV